MSYLENNVFPSVSKLTRFISIYKKESKELVKNYSPVLLIAICGKTFEKLIYNVPCPYYNDDTLISLNQSGFKPGNFCINQFLSITHEIIYLIKHLKFMECSYTF